MAFTIFNVAVIVYWTIIALLMAANFILLATGAISEHRARVLIRQDSLAALAAGFAPRTVEEVFLLEGRAFTGLTSDSLESFLAPYEPQPHDLDGLAAVASARG